MAISNHRLYISLKTMIERHYEDRMWDRYLATDPYSSFDDWKGKTEFKGNSTENLDKRQLDSIVHNSDDILKNYSIGGIKHG